MTLRYYPETDSLYIDLSERVGTEAVEVRPGIVLDFDEDGDLIGIDIDNASSKVQLERLEVQSLPVQAVALAS